MHKLSRWKMNWSPKGIKLNIKYSSIYVGDSYFYLYHFKVKKERAKNCVEKKTCPIVKHEHGSHHDLGE